MGIHVLSALEAGTQTFPTLSPAQLERIRPHGRVRTVQTGEILFRPGDAGMPFYVLLSGKLDIVQTDYDGERIITSYTAGQFAGEVNMISGQRGLATGRVAESGEFIEVPNDNFRALIATDAELSEIIMRAFILRRVALVTNRLGLILLGSRYSATTLRLREFLARNTYPHKYVDLDTDTAAQGLLDHFSIKADEVPVVICQSGKVLRNPTIQHLADCIGLNLSVDRAEVRDVIIVGAGPAGLAAAVYAASEGLSTLLIESEAPGGQAGSSSKIENYLGFPVGVSGQELAARALNQAQKFGAKMMVTHDAVKLNCDEHPYRVKLDDDTELSAKTIVIATGAQYNKPRLADLARFEGQGIYYSATFMESQLCGNEEVIVVGGGNSAGQAAVFLSQTARKVYMLVRSNGLAQTMSRYLIQRIMEHDGIELHFNTEIVGLEGENHLERVTWSDKGANETTTKNIRHVFIMAGASPRTEWLRGCIALDEKGFVLTGRDLDETIATGKTSWQLSRRPQMLETTLPGVFAIGDVRSNSVKRVASAVGEGSICIYLLHRALAEQ